MEINFHLSSTTQQNSFTLFLQEKYQVKNFFPDIFKSLQSHFPDLSHKS